MKSGSNLERVLLSGAFAVTGEINPPRSAEGAVVKEKARGLLGIVDAANITDNQTAMARLSSIASAKLTLETGLEPIVQMTCRDRNRIALQADALGASALGVGNMLCLTGDHQKFGDHPQARGVFDLDSVQLVAMLKRMRDEGRFLSGKKLLNKEKVPGTPPHLFLGVAANPFGDPEQLRLIKLVKKIAAGADFIQTQPVFDMARFNHWMERIRDLGIPEKAFILAGVMPVRSHKALAYMRDNVPGMRIDPDLIKRLESAANPEAEGLKIAIEQTAMLKQTPGLHGIHLMGVLWEEILPTIVRESGLLPRPIPAAG